MKIKKQTISIARKLAKSNLLSKVQTGWLTLYSHLRMSRDKRPMVVILSLGRGGHSYSAARAAKSLGLRVLLVSPDPVPHEMAYAHYLLRLDPLKQTHKIIEILRTLPIAGVSISIKHILLPAQAEIADALGLVSAGVRVGHLCNDKFAWREALEEAKCANPTFSNRYEDVSHLRVIQKPKTGTGSKGVVMLDPHSEVANRWNPQGDRSVGEDIYWEEYLEGEQFDVEGVSFNGVHKIIAIIKEKYELTDQMFPPKYFLFNPELPDSKRTLLEQETKRVLDASGVVNGAWHVESRIVDGKLVPIDFANRMGYERFMSRASGLDFARQHVSAFLPEVTEPFDLRPRSLIQFFAKTDDDFVEITRLSQTYPENVFDQILKPFFMGTVVYKGMIVLDSPDKTQFREIIRKLPLDQTDLAN